MRRWAPVVALAVALGGCASFEAAACGGPDDPGAGQKVLMPDNILGLKVKREKEATKRLNNETEPDATYQCPGEGVIYALRDGKELRAVLQISRLAPDARMEDREFLSGLVRGITGSILEPVELNGVDVYQTTSTGNEQIVTTWFHDRFMFFLTVREDQTLPGQPVTIDFDGLKEQLVQIEPTPV